MRAFLATLCFCLCVCGFSSGAEARVLHPHWPFHRQHVQAPGIVQGIGAGIGHMMDTIKPQHRMSHSRSRGVAATRRVTRAQHYAAHSYSGGAAASAFMPFEPGPFSNLFGAGQTVVNAGVGIAVGGVLSAAETVHFTYRAVRAMAGDPRPSAWCGWYMRHVLGVSDRSYNLARNWAHYGRAAGGPQVGAIVVWPHHVGRIVGEQNGQWIVNSGNDGHAVRTRARSLAGAIAFRVP